MKLYNVEVVETLSRVIEQQANSYDYRPYPSQDLKKSFNFNIDYDKTDKTIWIGTENTSSERFRCRNKDDLICAIKTYIDNNIELEPIKPEKDLSKKSKDYERYWLTLLQSKYQEQKKLICSLICKIITLMN